MLKHKLLRYILLSMMLSITSGAFAAPGDISTVAGGGIKDNVPASESMVSGPWNMFIDGSDNIYVADWRGNYITKIDNNGNFSVVVGNGLYKFDGDGLPPKEMSVRSPNSVAADSEGNVYFQFNSELRKVDPSGNVSTVVSGGFSGRLFIDNSDNIYYQSGRGILKIDAQTSAKSIVAGQSIIVPAGLAKDSQGNIYVTNTWQHTIFKLTPTGTIVPVAGTGSQGFSGDGGLAINANLSQPGDIAVDSAGNVYIADTGNHRIRKVDATTGNITTIGGTGEEFLEPDGQRGTITPPGDGGSATNSAITSPETIALDSAGNIYIATPWNDRIRQIDAATGNISTFAGGGTAHSSGTATANLQLFFPTGVSVDGADNIYISSTGGQVIYKVDASTNTATIVAGKIFESGFSGDGGSAIEAVINNPRRLYVDDQGHLYFLDNANQRVRRVDATTGIISTVAGNGTEGFGGDGGPATEASFKFPWSGGLIKDNAGNLIIADNNNDRIRKIDATTGIITTILGSPAQDGALASGVSINSIQDLSVDPSGNVYIADQGTHRIWKVDAATGVINSIAGNGTRGYSGDGGNATDAQLNGPRGVYADAAGNVYIGDRSNHRIRKVDTAGIITTIAGGNASGERGTLGGNEIEGAPATNVRLGNPQGISMTSNGELHFTDRLNKRIFRLDSAGNLHTVAGTYLGDNGPATEAYLANPHRIFVGSDGSQYITDPTHFRVRKVDPSGNITTLAGNGSSVYSGDGGAASAAGLTNPTGVFATPSGNVIITDSNRIRQVDTSGNITTIAGNPDAEIRGDGGPATQARVFAQSPFVDGAGNLYFANGSTVRKIDANGIITTVVGNGTNGFSGDGGPALEAQLNGAQNIFIDSAGNLFIADNGNRRIRKVDATTGIISTVAGNGERNSTGDGGPATDAALGDPWGVFVDSAGNIFIAERYERGGNRIRKVDPTGVITTVAGNGNTHYLGDGTAATDTPLWTPSDVFVDSNGDLFIVDQSNQRIRKVEGAGAPTTINPGVYQGPTSPELVATEAGSNVEVALPDLGDNTPAISLTFDNVASSGVTTVAPVESGPPPPEGLRLGEQTVYYDFNTTATFSGPVDLCFNYTGMNVGNEAELKLFHFVNDVWTDVTTSLDTQNNIICGQASSFSFFALLVPQPAAPTPKHLAVVQATVTQGGTPLVGATISLSRSIAGRPNEYLYQATTDASGKARVEIIIENILISKGASGYYSVQIANASGTVLDTYHSVPIAGQEEVAITFPIGERLIIESTRLIDFGLSANVPNPFNPSTTIAYQIPQSSDVSLVIYNALGQHVRTLTNTYQSAGQYRVTWDGKNTLGQSVSSGVYFYRLISNNNVQTRRMLLLK